jgi:hypothetical protein
VGPPAGLDSRGLKKNLLSLSGIEPRSCPLSDTILTELPRLPVGSSNINNPKSYVLFRRKTSLKLTFTVEYICNVVEIDFLFEVIFVAFFIFLQHSYATKANYNTLKKITMAINTNKLHLPVTNTF